MKKFILRLSNSNGHNFLLCADVKEEEIDIVKEKIARELKIQDTNAHWCNGRYYSAIDPKILKQLKDITGYDFVGFEPDLYLSFSNQSFHLPGSI